MVEIEQTYQINNLAEDPNCIYEFHKVKAIKVLKLLSDPKCVVVQLQKGILISKVSGKSYGGMHQFRVSLNSLLLAINQEDIYEVW